MSEIQVIQGDTLEQQIIIKNVETADIEAVCFSCEKLNICKECQKVGDCFVLEISHEETSKFETGVCCYDITIKLKGDKIKTIVYREKLKVLPKVNGVDW